VIPTAAAIGFRPSIFEVAATISAPGDDVDAAVRLVARWARPAHHPDGRGLLGELPG
jgi:hypothetical protein